MEPHRLWGVSNPGTTPLLDAGLEALDSETRYRLLERLEAARQDLIAACINAAFATGAVSFPTTCPDTADDLIHPKGPIYLDLNTQEST